ncbi:MAG TPA: hypothetical protein VGJ53_09250 [Micromonosporaceae bacterium]
MRWLVPPADGASGLDWLAFEQSGVLTVRQATAAVGEGKVRGLIRSGRWRAVCRGIVLVENGRLARDQQLWVAVLAAGHGAVLAGATAATESGVRGLRPDPIWVLVPAARARSQRLPLLPPDMPGVAVRRTTLLPTDQVQLGRPMRTTTARALIDAAAWARCDDEARTALAVGCQQRRVTPEELLAIVVGMPRVRRHALIVETITDIAGGAEALSEIDFLELCRRYGLPRPDLQERRRDATGRQRFIDVLWKRWGVHVEVDGAHHMDPRHWADDMFRQNDLWIEGERILRYPSWFVRRNPAKVADQLRRALIAKGWTP